MIVYKHNTNKETILCFLQINKFYTFYIFVNVDRLIDKNKKTKINIKQKE